MKKNFFLSFLITFIILFLSYVTVGFFSIKTFLTSDLGAQYYHFLYMFKEVLDGTSNLFYSFKIGIGNSFYDIFLYYLNSPINLILKFVSYDGIYDFLLISTLFKISLCSSTMYIYMNYHFKNKKYLVFFSICYALSSAIIGNYLQIMWLDSYIVAPLVLLGIDKLITEDKVIMYVLSLSFCIFSNYYIGYIICFFSVLYFIYRLTLHSGSKKKSIIKFCIMSVIAGMMTMFTNLTGLINILNLGKTQSLEFGFNTTPTSIISSLFIWNNTQENVLNFTNPRMYISILLLLFIFIYFFNKNIKINEKIKSGLMICIFLAFMLFEQLNSIWHAFSVPTGFNFRYVFLINIFLIYLSCKGFENINYIDKKYYFLITYIIFIFAFCCYFVNFVDMKYIYISLFFLLLYLIIIYFKKYYYLFILLIIELFLNSIIFYNSIPTLFDENNIVNDNILNIINDIKNIDNDKFYRMDFMKLDEISFNDNILYGYDSVSSFVSTTQSNWINFFDKIGYEIGNNAYLFESYDITNSILGIKYYADTKGYDKVIGNYGKYNIYKNDNALSLGFVVSDSVKNEWNCDSTFDCQEKIINLMNNNDTDIFVDVPVKKINEYEYQIELPKNIYKYFSISFEYKNSLDVDVYFNGELSGTFNEENGSVFKTSAIISNDEDEKIIIKIVDKNNNLINAKVESYIFDYNVYLNEINKLKKNQLNIEIFKDDYIKGTITDGGTMFFSIPYSDYWNVYVDGKKIETFKIFDVFLGADIDEGKHIVELKYEINNFKYGLLLSVISFVSFIIYIFYKKSKKIEN